MFKALLIVAVVLVVSGCASRLADMETRICFLECDVKTMAMNNDKTDSLLAVVDKRTKYHNVMGKQVK